MYYRAPILPVSLAPSGGSSVLVGLVASWYSLAAVSVCTSKFITQIFPYPLHLCFIQLLFAAVICIWSARLFGQVPLADFVGTLRREIVLAGLLFTLGFIFTNFAFSCASVSFAETIKAAEPISTLLLGLLFYNERASLLTYSSLIPVTAGVALSCYSSTEFLVFCFVHAMFSNFCFSGRAVVIKKFSKGEKNVLGEMVLFGQMCAVGCAVVLPLCIFSESIRVISDFAEKSMGEFIYLGGLFLLNGCAFTSYNLLSMLVLSRTQLFTHTILNAIRRVFIITASVLVFGNYISATNILGILIAVGGGCFFSYVKSFRY
jgi:drug/metabolite transporter (DMT)-like permease